MEQIGINAQRAATALAQLTTSKKNDALECIAQCIDKRRVEILEANKNDVIVAEMNEIAPSMIERLVLTDARIDQIIDGIINVKELKDPVGKILEQRNLDNGLQVVKKVVPLGVVGIIYESRPNVTVDAFALCFKSGNSVILKGGKEALNTNTVLERVIQEGLDKCNIDRLSIQLIKSIDRNTTLSMMKMNKYIDVLIPRGSSGLIRAVVENSTIPVIQTGSGNCHIYVDEFADLEMALSIVENAKCQRVSVCNAMESLVVHKDVAISFLKMLVDKIPNVTLWGDTAAHSINEKIKIGSEADYFTEYLGLEMSVKVVDTLEEAISHINKYNTKHSESIVTDSDEHANRFVNGVDSSTVYVNASTRFTDGFVFGLGAEIGISTQKLHARGPMGMEALTSYKYIVKGKGQTRV